MKRIQREGRLLHGPSGDNADGTTNFVPAMSAERLLAGYRAILAHIYSPAHYYERVRTFLREYKAPKFRARLRAADVMTFLRVVLHLGIIGKELAHFWRLMIWTNIRRPELLQLAVTLAIYGHHFRKVTAVQMAWAPGDF